ncbi:hypothetical protein DF185_22680 [Marinifilum breve]|uniref:Peptidase S74 domain-containing protein n=1 Tax=Marinifilum breve TaxID=2184082 RepID=A0A2V3ZUT4_9BACT|nr:hypothetical protein [Marinifilum breve]PXX95187.1 hypothetical protein DF185_22680 [Marinifilum breve]
MKKLLFIFFIVLISNVVNAQTNGATVEAGKWYRIAQNSGNRANARFILWDHISSGGHSTLEFKIGTSYNYRNGISFSLINHNYYHQLTFTKVRVLNKDTYDPQYLEVYVVRSGNVNYSMLDNVQSYGWKAVGWSKGTIPSGYISSEYDVNYLFAIGDSQNNFVIERKGNVGIGITNPNYRLDVSGTIRAQELKVDMQGADFVFEEDYQLRSLEEVENFVQENKHLPDVAPAKEMQKNGVNQSEMNQKLLQKIEELTLYTIEQQKQLDKQSKLIEQLLSKQK